MIQRLMSSLFVTLLISGCWVTHPLHSGEHVSIERAGDVHVDDFGFKLRLWFCVPPEYGESIQNVNIVGTVDGWETHKQRMCWPDYQTLKRETDEPFHQRRINTVWAGETKDAPWDTPPGRFKGVVLIDGWLDENGNPKANRTYFRWGGKQGGTIVRVLEPGLTYTLDYWTSHHPDNPLPGRALLRVYIGGETYDFVGA
jgi:hypothetical protein